MGLITAEDATFQSLSKSRSSYIGNQNFMQCSIGESKAETVLLNSRMCYNTINHVTTSFDKAKNDEHTSDKLIMLPDSDILPCTNKVEEEERTLRSIDTKKVFKIEPSDDAFGKTLAVKSARVPAICEHAKPGVFHVVTRQHGEVTSSVKEEVFTELVCEAWLLLKNELISDVELLLSSKCFTRNHQKVKKKCRKVSVQSQSNMYQQTMFCSKAACSCNVESKCFVHDHKKVKKKCQKVSIQSRSKVYYRNITCSKAGSSCNVDSKRSAHHRKMVKKKCWKGSVYGHICRNMVYCVTCNKVVCLCTIKDHLGHHHDDTFRSSSLRICFMLHGFTFALNIRAFLHLLPSERNLSLEALLAIALKNTPLYLKRNFKCSARKSKMLSCGMTQNVFVTITSSFILISFLDLVICTVKRLPQATGLSIKSLEKTRRIKHHNRRSKVQYLYEKANGDSITTLFRSDELSTITTLAFLRNGADISLYVLAPLYANTSTAKVNVYAKLTCHMPASQVKSQHLVLKFKKWLFYVKFYHGLESSMRKVVWKAGFAAEIMNAMHKCVVCFVSIKVNMLLYVFDNMLHEDMLWRLVICSFYNVDDNVNSMFCLIKFSSFYEIILCVKNGCRLCCCVVAFVYNNLGRCSIKRAFENTAHNVLEKVVHQLFGTGTQALGGGSMVDPNIFMILANDMPNNLMDKLTKVDFAVFDKALFEMLFTTLINNHFMQEDRYSNCLELLPVNVLHFSPEIQVFMRWFNPNGLTGLVFALASLAVIYNMNDILKVGISLGVSCISVALKVVSCRPTSQFRDAADLNDLLSREAVIIASALKQLSSLMMLNLHSNGISNVAAEEISTIIVDLLLGNNQLCYVGVCKVTLPLGPSFAVNIVERDLEVKRFVPSPTKLLQQGLIVLLPLNCSITYEMQLRYIHQLTLFSTETSLPGVGRKGVDSDILCSTRSSLSSLSFKAVYIPPEVLETYLRYETKLDVFSLAYVFLAVMFHDTSSLAEVVATNLEDFVVHDSPWRCSFYFDEKVTRLLNGTYQGSMATGITLTKFYFHRHKCDTINTSMHILFPGKFVKGIFLEGHVKEEVTVSEKYANYFTVTSSLHFPYTWVVSEHWRLLQSDKGAKVVKPHIKGNKVHNAVFSKQDTQHFTTQPESDVKRSSNHEHTFADNETCGYVDDIVFAISGSGCFPKVKAEECTTFWKLCKPQFASMDSKTIFEEVLFKLTVMVVDFLSLETVHLRSIDEFDSTVQDMQIACINSELQDICFRKNELLEGAVCTQTLAAGPKQTVEECHLNEKQWKIGTVTLGRVFNTLSLELLGLEDNHLYEKVWLQIAAAIKANKPLEKVWLNDNHLGSIFVPTINWCRIDTSLGMHYTNISELVADSIARVKFAMECMVSDSNFKSSVVSIIAPALTCVSLLKYLNAYIAASVADDLISVININPLLERLALGGILMHNKFLRIVEPCARLYTLKLLDLSHNSIRPVETVKLVSSISKMKSIGSLSLNWITLNAMENLCSNLNKIALRYLKLCSRLLYHECALISYQYKDKTIEGGKNQLNMELKVKSKLSQFDSKLMMFNDMFQIIKSGAIKFPKSVSTLKVLDLTDNNLCEEVGVELAAAISANSLVEKVWLGGNHLGSSSVVIVNALKGFTRFKQLDLSDNGNCSSDLAPAVVSMVTSNKLIEKLHLKGNNLKTDGVIKISESLRSRSTLRIINFRSNHVTEEATKTHVAIVKQLLLYKLLGLSLNSISPVSAVQVASILKLFSVIEVTLVTEILFEKFLQELCNLCKSFLLIQKNYCCIRNPYILCIIADLHAVVLNLLYCKGNKIELKHSNSELYSLKFSQRFVKAMFFSVLKMNSFENGIVNEDAAMDHLWCIVALKNLWLRGNKLHGIETPVVFHLLWNFSAFTLAHVNVIMQNEKHASSTIFYFLLVLIFLAANTTFFEKTSIQGRCSILVGDQIRCYEVAMKCCVYASLKFAVIMETSLRNMISAFILLLSMAVHTIFAAQNCSIDSSAIVDNALPHALFCQWKTLTHAEITGLVVDSGQCKAVNCSCYFDSKDCSISEILNSLHPLPHKYLFKHKHVPISSAQYSLCASSCEPESGEFSEKSNKLVITTNTNYSKHAAVTSRLTSRLIGFVDIVHTISRPTEPNRDSKDIDTKANSMHGNYQHFTSPTNVEPLSSHGNASLVDDALTIDGRKQHNPQQTSVVSATDGTPLIPKAKCDDVCEKDGKLLMPGEKDGELPMSHFLGASQMTSSHHDPTLHKLNTGIGSTNSSGAVSYSPLGAQVVKALPLETDTLPEIGPQRSVSYGNKFEGIAQISHEEIKRKAGLKTAHKYEIYQKASSLASISGLKQSSSNLPKTSEITHQFNQAKSSQLQQAVGLDATFNDFKSKSKPLPKRSCIVCGNRQFPLASDLLGHPHMDYYFVKERTEIRPGHYLAKLVLHHNNSDGSTNKASVTSTATVVQQSQAAVVAADSALEKDGLQKDGAVTECKHFPLNVNRTGYVVFSSDLTRFTGNKKYPLPSRKAAAVKLGKGGNGFVFAIFHNGKEYAVKKTVYRPNEIRVHSQMAHSNLVNLDAVLIGEEHERHRGKFYAFCFMTKCDMDFRSVISTKEHGCLKHLKLQLSQQRDVWELVMINVKYILRSVLKALVYMHDQGLVHRDVKASNILLKMNCECKKPLMCACPNKFSVKLGDFDSSTTVPGYGLRIEPHQMIRYASVLPLGTMGYRAPEVSMHLVIAGPYEVLYTTAVDIWSFGCLLLNLLIGKCGPLKQRGEASLLLSTQGHSYSAELYNKIIKVKELQKYYSDTPELVDLVQKCLQVEVHCRPSANQLLQLDVLRIK